MGDGLNEVGKSIRQGKKNSEAALRRYSENFPKIERVRDVITAGILNEGDTTYFTEPCNFEMYFKTKRDDNRILLDLVFLPACCQCEEDPFIS